MCCLSDKVHAIDDRVVAERARLVTFIERDTAKANEIEPKLTDARTVVAYLRAALEKAEKEERALQADYIRAYHAVSVRKDALTAIDAINSLI